MTRRRLLATGGAAGAAAMLGGSPWTARAATTESDTPPYLLRSSYRDLSTPMFTAGAVSLKLESVSDLQIAASDSSFVNSEDAFALTFTSSAPLEGGIYGFSHPDLGEFSFFIGAVEGKGAYEVVVNRSVNAPKHYPRPPRQNGTDASATAADQPTIAYDHLPQETPAAPGKQSGHKPRKPVAHVRKASARRLGQTLVTDVVLGHGVHLKSASVWLLRGSRVVAAATVRHPHGQRLAVRLPVGHRARGGRYVLLIATLDRHGREQTRRSKITVQ